MEFGSIEREVYVEASPEIVFDVVSSPAADDQRRLAVDESVVDAPSRVVA